MVGDIKDHNRVVISKDANATLEEVVNMINSGFESGSVTRSELANYTFQNLSKFLSLADIKAVTAQHFDPKKVLNTMLKSPNELPEEVQRRCEWPLALPTQIKSAPLKPILRYPQKKMWISLPAHKRFLE